MQRRAGCNVLHPALDAVAVGVPVRELHDEGEVRRQEDPLPVTGVPPSVP